MPARSSYVVIKADDQQCRFDILDRDWGVLWGPFFKEGEQFARTIGVYEHITVDGGIPKGSYVIRNRRLLLESAELLLRGVERDEELLRYNYTFSFSDVGGVNGGGLSGFRVRGFVGSINTRPKGFCWLQLSQIGGTGLPRIVEWIDMRVRKEIATDDRGALRVHRVAAKTAWKDTLPSLIDFLSSQQAQEVRIEHFD